MELLQTTIQGLMDFWGVAWVLAIVFLGIAIAAIIVLFVHDYKRDKELQNVMSLLDDNLISLEKNTEEIEKLWKSLSTQL